MAESKQRRPVAAQRTGAPEKTSEGERTRDPEVDARELLVKHEVITQDEADELESREAPRVRQITGGEIHWFSGGRLARETR